MTTYHIKPLEWSPHGNSLSASTVFGLIWVYDNVWHHYLDRGLSVANCTSLADGKAKAEAFYRQRLLPALEVVE